jgi:hypothetical protein
MNSFNGLLLVFVMVLFPQLPIGMRIEHIVLPAVFLITLIHFVMNGVKFDDRFICGVLCLGGAAMYAAVGTLAGGVGGEAASPFNMLVRLLMPVLMFLSFFGILYQTTFPLKRAAVCIVIACSFAAAMSLSLTLFGRPDILGFWVHTDIDGVWAQSLVVGRYNGIFNQPLEAGVFYGTGALAATYLLHIGRHKNLIFLALILIFIGGAATFSKNFVVLGAGLSILFAYWTRVASKIQVVILGIFVFSIIFVALQRNPDYLESFYQLYADGGILLAVTAGRLGSQDTEVSLLFGELWSNGSWLSGLGLGSYIPLDNGYLEYFYQGGIVSLAGYLLFLFCFLLISVVNLKFTAGKLLFILVVFIALASIGGPVITANRANLVLILLLVACVVDLQSKALLSTGNSRKRDVR